MFKVGQVVSFHDRFEATIININGPRMILDVYEDRFTRSKISYHYTITESETRHLNILSNKKFTYNLPAWF